jgi:hypothetical protein
MFFAIVFIDLIKFLRRFLNEPIDCPWCYDHLDDELGVFERVSGVAVTMEHAGTCVSYKGFLREPKKGLVWQLQNLPIIRGSKSNSLYWTT